MQVTSLLSRNEDAQQHDESCSVCGHDHEHTPVHMWQTLVGVVFVINAFVVDRLFDQAHTIASASAFVGAIVLGYPIMVTAVKDLLAGLLGLKQRAPLRVLWAFAYGLSHAARVGAYFRLLHRMSSDC